MALTNHEKSFLTTKIKSFVLQKTSLDFIVTYLKRHGYKESTIRNYYKTFKEG